MKSERRRSLREAPGCRCATDGFMTLRNDVGRHVRTGSFLGLMPVMRDALMGEQVSLGWPMATAVAALTVAAVAARGIFERQAL
jgi:hypothetical protein